MTPRRVVITGVGLANADRVDRQAEFFGCRHEHAAARGAIELGHDEAGDARGLAEHLDLRQCVLAHRGVEHQQHRMRRRNVDLP